ncbi:MAG: hypothetical protein Greene041662_832 [Candidatus Peregrinibacteria bacterium Greene0416_62]|nr:MAG: hypothetical protein Greene041662_832 [Candidatus Peregrinibacteria bacterium Greene0416_62]TSD00148.1 MAG: hypothetical protein Greene101449_309 [Candidatus Peregrinibacteria bacterium Greene1014_49]
MSERQDFTANTSSPSSEALSPLDILRQIGRETHCEALAVTDDASVLATADEILRLSRSYQAEPDMNFSPQTIDAIVENSPHIERARAFLHDKARKAALRDGGLDCERPSPEAFVDRGMSHWVHPKRDLPHADVVFDFMKFCKHRNIHQSTHRGRVYHLGVVLAPHALHHVDQFIETHKAHDSAIALWQCACSTLIRILWTYTPELGDLEDLLSYEILKALEQNVAAASMRAEQRRHPVDERDCEELP